MLGAIVPAQDVRIGLEMPAAEETRPYLRQANRIAGFPEVFAPVCRSCGTGVALEWSDTELHAVHSGRILLVHMEFPKRQEVAAALDQIDGEIDVLIL